MVFAFVADRTVVIIVSSYYFEIVHRFGETLAERYHARSVVVQRIAEFVVIVYPNRSSGPKVPLPSRSPKPEPSPSLSQAGVHFSLHCIVRGLVILVAVYLDVRRRKE